MKIGVIVGGYFKFQKGGAELQTSMLINYFFKKGHNISYLCYGNRNRSNPIEESNNLNIYQVKKPFKNIKFLTYLNRNHIYNLLKKIDADILYQRGAFHFSNLISSYGRKRKIPVISGISMDTMCIKNKIKLNKTFLINCINGYLNKKYYRDSDLVIAQTYSQQRLLKQNFNKDSIVIPNGHPVPSPPFKKSSPPIIAWIANIKWWKQPEIFIKLAKELEDTNAQFVYAGRSAKGGYQKMLVDKTKKLPNLKYLGEIPFEKTNELLSKASLFVNTSQLREGFPNTYIQAWMRETPVVALNADPDDLLKRKKIGFHSKTFEQLVKDVRYLIKNEDVRKEMGKRARKYAIENHDIEKIGKRYLEVFEELMKE